MTIPTPFPQDSTAVIGEKRTVAKVKLSYHTDRMLGAIMFADINFIHFMILWYQPRLVHSPAGIAHCMLKTY